MSEKSETETMLDLLAEATRLAAEALEQHGRELAELELRISRLEGMAGV
jgi:hypothetical protein